MFSERVLLIFLAILYPTFAQDCVMLVTKEDAWDKKLHMDKMKDYHFRQPPKNQSCVPVKVHFQLKTFAFDEYADRFTAKMWTRMIWRDERLIWSPEDYGGIKKMIVLPTDIWTPSLKLLNSVEPDYFSMEIEECVVQNNGEVMCVPELIYESFCIAKLRDWPFDVQNCTLQFGDGERLTTSRFSFKGKAMSLGLAEYGNGWYIMMNNFKENPNSDVQLSITLTMERQASGIIVVLTGPCFVLSILNITSILLTVNDYIRLGFSCFSLIGHFTFLFFIDEFLPKHSGDTPVILFFIRDSIILTITSVLFTLVLSKIVKRKTVPFDWVSLVSNKVFFSFGRYLILPRWRVDPDAKDTNNVNNKEIWMNVANILNSAYLVVVIIVYIILFNAYMPKQPPAEY
ncbi:neuronal acetylcholine receptor subunit beta-3-like [Leguminivora glycinivorella]|uniref:neuronal acetylcholine receptor subunit beta-3-like n=1 Tax=Leguminivora glycinivorella TaxID=1035111 RepID=UPI0020100900|nr:neuronal acetylcholine receptor subunit beta-3-like [Leguminivora glycinivorella]